MPETPTTNRVAERVRAAMAAKGISQTVLGTKLHRSQHAVSRRLLGYVDFSITELETIARELDVPLAELVA